jgi:hypothetical protein
MSSQLDILALEPFYGGARRAMLETLMRYSRHRWTLLKLPPRRIERRLSAAAHWFSEQLQRHWSGKIDVILTSEALNLADLNRLVPVLAKKPSVVYFHENQLPDVRATEDKPLDFVNLNTATAATEIWFNSAFHLRLFLARANAFIGRHSEISTMSPSGALAGKAHVMSPPIDLGAINERFKAITAPGKGRIKRPQRNIFVETRDADVGLLNAGIGVVRRRGEAFELTTVGPVEGLDASISRRTLPEQDDLAHVNALFDSGIFLSAKPTATCDFHAVRALAAGCWPIFPRGGVYPELLPKSLHSSCLFDPMPEPMGTRLQDAWHLQRPDGYEDELHDILSHFEPMDACRAMDQRLEELAVAHTLRR